MSNGLFHISNDRKTLLKCALFTSDCVTIPDGIESIADHAFKDCNKISEVILPDNLVSIGWGAFKGCTRLENIKIPRSVKELHWECFKDCENLSSIYLPEGIFKIGTEAFCNCRSLRSIVIPSTISELGSEVFMNCSSLETISLPDNLSSISHKTFYNCISLYKIQLPKKLHNIGSEAFSGCESLVSITIPNSVRTIFDEAFANCVNLNCLIVESENITIAPTAFLNCLSINRLYLANFIPNIVISAFGDCTNLNIISPLSDLQRVQSKESTDYHKVHKDFAYNLKCMSLYYRLFGMNLTQMKWSDSLRNQKSFKEPINPNWLDYKANEQPLSELLNLDWSYSCGIGLVLGYNNYRALDVDNCNIFYLEALNRDRGLDAFIDEFLKTLGLPANYPWVVKSGSGEGFHVIFRCDDTVATRGIDSISFQHNEMYGNAQYEIFDRIELRWADHLVLPPSIHASGGMYLFRDQNLPSELPETLSLRTIDTLLYKYCGNRTFVGASYNGVNFEYTEVCKIISRHDSYLSPHDYKTDTVEWLEHINSGESKNSLALKYLFGNDVEADGIHAVNILKTCSCQSAIFNLLQLYACGFEKVSYEEYQKLLKDLDKTLFSEHLEKLYVNAKINIPEPELYLFLDTETTGLPKIYDAPSSDVDNWPRLIQLSWMITDKDQNVIERHNLYIKPNGFVIPQDSIKIHGITTKYALENGIDVVSAFKMLDEDLTKVKFIVGHNVSFDEKIVEAECYRSNYDVISFMDKFLDSLCTMKTTADFCKLPAKFNKRYKYPTLQELHRKLFGFDFTGAHDAFSDITATMKCFWELRKRGWSNDDFRLYPEDNDLPF